MRPRSIAVAGASPDPASFGGSVLRNITNAGFKGDLYLVSPTRKEINGAPCLPTLNDLPFGVDVAVLNIPRAALRDAVVACVKRGVGSAIVFASGFAEAGEAGRAEQNEITDICRAGGLALLGPNCLGLANYVDGVALTFEALDFQPMGDKPRHVGVVAQSGASAANIRSALIGRGVPVSYVVATGNEAVLHAHDFIRYYVEAGVAAVAVYAEQIRDPQAFLEVARLARKAGVPIVMAHPGSSARGQAAAQSHTGAMAGEYTVMKACVQSEAVVLVETMDEVFDATAILYRYPKPVRGLPGVVTNSGAIRGLTLDFSESIGLPLAELSKEDIAELQKLAPHTEAENPFDIGTAGFADNTIFTTSTTTMLANPKVGSVLLAMAGGGPAQQRGKGAAITPVAVTSEKPVAIAIIGDEYPLDPGFIANVRETETPFFRSPERALRALAAVHKYSASIANIADAAPKVQVPSLPGHGVLPEYLGKAFLRDAGIPVPEGGLAKDADEGAAIAKRIGYPVVIKAQASALAHKSDVGGVIINLKDETELRAAWTRLLDNVSKAPGGAKLDGVLVEQMSKPGLEMVIGGRNDPQWGPVVVVGLGGVWVEALGAVETLPAHAGRAEILERLKHMRGSKLLGAFRGQPPRDVAAIADVVMKMGAVLRAHPHLTEVDVNPLMVFAEANGAMALDALFVVE
jgi:acyl-CoA synthetase (NDP forming)